MSQIPAPLLSRHLGILVLALSALVAVAFVALPALGFWPLAATLVLAAIHQAFLALAVVIAGRTGLTGRHAPFPVTATLGSAGLLLLAALTEIVSVFVIGLAPEPPVAWLPILAGGLAAATGLLLVLFGVAVLRAAVVHRGVRILPLLAALAVLAAAVVLALDPLGAGPVALGAASLLLGGVGAVLFTPRTLP